MDSSNIILSKPCSHKENLTTTCQYCWLFTHKKKYNLMWGGDGNVKDFNGKMQQTFLDHGYTEIIKVLVNKLIKILVEKYPDLLKSFLVALDRYNLAKRRDVSDADYVTRLIICDTCENNIGGVCKLCGCFIRLKAKWSTEDCAASKWPKINLPVISNENKGCGCGVSNNR